MSAPVAITVTLGQPVQREGGEVSAITLRKPDTGNLRGLKLTDVMQSDVNAMITLLPRISDPFLTEAEISALDPADFAELAGTILGFFMSPAQKALVAQMTGG